MDKPVKIKAGRYTYKGVVIMKMTRLGFVYTIHSATGWHYGGLRTLAVATAEIDAQIAAGTHEVRRGHMYRLAA